MATAVAESEQTMIKVENIETWGFEHAVRGARNPYNSWHKSDSGEGVSCNNCPYFCGVDEDGTAICENAGNDFCPFIIGDNDLALMQKLYKAGSEHRKYLRQIFVSMDIVGPIYWISELDTYKVGTSRNSCSFQHKGTAKEFTSDDFTIDEDMPKEELETMIAALNKYRSLYLATHDYKYFRLIRQLLPSGYNQRFTFTMNYENVVNIINQRENHKLTEWREFTDILKKLPYVKKIIGEGEEQ